MIKTARAYIVSLAAVARWKLLGELALMVGCSVSEGFGLLFILPILQAAGFDLGGQGGVNRYAQVMVESVRAVGFAPTLVPLLAVWFAIVSARAFLMRWRSLGILALQQDFELALRSRLYRAIVNANWLFLCRARGADFVDALAVQISRVGEATQNLLSFAALAFVTFLYLCFALKLSPAITALIGVSGALLGLVSKRRTRAMHESGSDLSAAFNELSAASVEQMGNLKTVKAYNAEDAYSAIYIAIATRVSRMFLKITRHLEATTLWFDIGSALILCLVLYAALKLLTVPRVELLVLLALFIRLMPQVGRLQNYYQSFVALLPAFAAVTELERRCLAAAEVRTSADPPPQLQHMLRLERVSFRYPRSERFVLQGVDMAIPAGRITAIVGPSGAGKSTAADLIMGLIEPEQGRLTIDGAALERQQAYAWRERIGYVAQETFLFHDTVRRNLQWARTDASEAEMMRALKMAAADDFVLRMPAGLDTVVGDRGALVSQGERQRLALARALLRRPALLVLDEAFNSLDAENEQRIWQAIERLRGEVTIVLIAHRFATVRSADVIHVLEDGKVVESGDWTALYANENGRLRTLYEAQKVFG
jgi:ATP-binding cassette subfamily C protein